MLYTFAYANGTESLPSPNSVTFRVLTGNIPQVTLPPLARRRDRLQHLIFRTPSAAAGSATRFASDITNSNLRLSDRRAVQIGVSRSQNPACDGRPDRAPDGRRHRWRQPGPRVRITSSIRSPTPPVPSRSAARPRHHSRSLWAGHLPQVMLPPLPNDANGLQHLCVRPIGRPELGRAVRPLGQFVDCLPPERGAGWRPQHGARLTHVSVVPTINPTGGGTTGGGLLMGTYDLEYTITYAGGAQSFSSPISAKFTMVAGQIRRSPSLRCRPVRRVTTSTCPTTRQTPAP